MGWVLFGWYSFGLKRQILRQDVKFKGGHSFRKLKRRSVVEFSNLTLEGLAVMVQLLPVGYSFFHLGRKLITVDTKRGGHYTLESACLDWLAQGRNAPRLGVFSSPPVALSTTRDFAECASAAALTARHNLKSDG